MNTVKPRRTQRERRETTIATLIDATIESLLEVGYAGTTVKEICTRAELSHGALFRFFPSILELVLAAGREVGKRQIEEFQMRFARAKKGPNPVGAALKLLRAGCRSPANAVFYELLLASRTDPVLRAALEKPMQQYYDTIRAAAREVPGLEKVPAELLEVVLFTMIHTFDGETLSRFVLPRPDLEERRMELLEGMIRFIGVKA